ncbi:unnamed protein product (macronuclear) [Paramecium tetraurelia]|uniref:Uncharacterized protein n=1 Tax=Paramecium tetraurelia TaxID=5888 RepID=A0C6T7_PARTE|nr:uncharacterized protein GSPATT00035633001 [Paramecium tetraurelia]CAK66504.1 unnamed protein product [Paramecium tetraurelia]|eukprot:XP_001433901.1 hypothetical protein (macronuclear) [Paramecium tetraurelia strain d4-2]
MICRISIGSMQLAYSAFTENTFSSNQGWSVIGGSPGYDSRDGSSIFGGNNFFGAGVSIYKLILISASHHTVKLKLKIWAINAWDNEMIQTKINGEIIDEQTVSSNLANSFGQYLYQEIIVSHIQRSLILEITSTLQAPSLQKYWGIRDIYIYTYNCPVGCTFCTYLDVDASQCKPYILKMSYFTSFSFYSNEVKMCAIVTNQLYLTEISTFGKYSTGTTLTRQYFLDPHYQLRITFQFWKFDALQNSQYQLQLDNSVIWIDSQKKYQTLSLCGSSTKPEQYYDVDITVNHTNQYLTFSFVSDTISPTDSIGIREFNVYMLACESPCTLCSPGLGSSCITGTKLTQSEIENDLTLNSFASQLSWGSYVPSDATGQISKSFLTDSYFLNMNYLSLYNLLYKDFVLEDHEKIKIIFQVYSSGPQQNINLKIDEDYDEIVQIGQNDPSTSGTCTTTLQYDLEDYSYFEYTFDHTANFVRVQFESTPYSSGNYRYGFNQFKIYSISQDCSTTPCTQVEKLVNSNFFTTTFSDPKNWQLLTYSPIAVTTCDSKSVAGGISIGNKNIFIQKRVSLTQSHSILRLQLSVYFLEAWVPTKSLRILADKVIIWDQSVDYHTNLQNLCSSNTSYKDQIVTVDVSFTHNKGTVIFQIIIQNGDGSEYFAIRDYHLYYSS